MGAYRLKKGGRINRDKEVSFRFNGRSLNGFEGDTIASALLANNVRQVGRSFKYHRLRGVMSAGPEEGGALFNVNDGAMRIANVKGTMAELRADMQVRAQNVFPSLAFDIGAVNGLFAPFLTAGFYYKTFMGLARNTAFWMFCEKFIRKAAGLGKASRLPDPNSYDIAYKFCDVLVVGAGPAGLLAATELAEQGQKIILVEQDFEAGGSILSTGRPEDLQFRDSLLKRFERAGGRLMLRATAFGLYDGLVTGVLERCSDHLQAPDPHSPREITHIIHPLHIVLATGASERGFAFGNNDRPGVMLTGAIRSYACRYGVMAGRSAVLATCHDGSYDDAIMLARLGMEITLIDARNKPSRCAKDAQAAGINVLAGRVPVNVAGVKLVAALEIAEIDEAGEISENTAIIGCDVVGVSGGYSPVIHLPSHRGVKPCWEASINAFVAGKTIENIYMTGSADGIYDHQACLDHALQIVQKINGEKIEAKPRRRIPGGMRALFEVQIKGRKLKSFIDPQHDVTSEDVRQAHREGFVSVEHMKRYTTLGMATDQGRVGNVLGLAVMAQAQGLAVGKSGVTTFRPPYTPVSIGALAARERGRHWRPTRRTPMHHTHLAAGAVMTDAGAWKRAWYYPRGDENIDDAYVREAATTRQNVAMVDVSTLGKIAVQGPDATEFLNRIYVNPFAKLAIGKARYGIMLRDDGMVLDDGTTWRLAEDDYFMTTTTAQAAPVMLFLEELLQRRWTDLQVHVTSVTDQWAGMAVAGPYAREVLAAEFPQLDWSDEAFPFMGVVETTLRHGKRDIACRIARISFSGERAFEIYVPSDSGAQIWSSLAHRIEQTGGCLYGMEALGALRIEKGHVTAAELDGRVTLEDAGFGRMASKTKPFIGSVLRQRPSLQDEKRPQLVGIYPKDRTRKFSAGAILCATDAVSGFGEGWVTAVTHSPAIGHWIGLGFLTGGAQAWQGKTIMVADPVRDNFVEAEIVSPHMFDAKGDRQHG